MIGSAPRAPNADETVAGKALGGMGTASAVELVIEPKVPAPNATVPATLVPVTVPLSTER